MDVTDQRQAERIACRVPLRLRIDGTWHAVLVVDISRTGVRMQVPVAELGLDPGATFAEAVERLTAHLPRQVSAEFEPERLGGLVRRSLRVVRISFPPDVPATVEIGCALDRDVDDTEAAVLGLPLPPAVAKDHAGVTDGVAHALRVVVCPADGDATGALLVPAEEVTEQGVLLRLLASGVPGLPEAGDDVRPLAAAFAERYGPTTELAVYEGDDALWEGPAHLTHVEVDGGAPGALVVGFAYDRPLGEPERRALRLP